jgi:hypothetical protein
MPISPSNKEGKWDNYAFDICTFNEKVFRKYRIGYNGVYKKDTAGSLK